LILLFGRGYNETGNGMYAALHAFADEVGWRRQTVERTAPVGSKRQLGLDRKTVRDLLSFWKPSGVIVDCFGVMPDEAMRDFGRLPHVFLNFDPDGLGRTAAYVACDSEAVGELAARELLSLGFNDYAYVAGFDLPWARIRGETFARLARENGKTFRLFSETSRTLNSAGRIRALADWCASLPKPCGIFAANDLIADQVISACRQSGVSVPDEVAVVGVDDNASICENAAVSISSMPLNYPDAGRQAGELLADLMAKRPGVGRCRRFGVLGFVRRGSTRIFPKTVPRVVRAVEYIRQHACEGVSPTDVVAVMTCSRRLADKQFREVVGHTILDEIHEVRLRRAKELLADLVLPISAMPERCGYESLVDLCRVFKRQYGMTMSRYRSSLSVK